MRINLDKTFCLAEKCERSKNCGRSYCTLINLGFVFDRPVSMCCFYHINKKCDYYVELEDCDE